MVNLVEIQPPGSDRLFVVLCAEELTENILFASLDDVVLDRG